MNNSVHHLRILHLVNDVENFGNGIVNVAIDLAIEQRRAGHDVTVASAGGHFGTLLEANDVRHLHLPQTGRMAVAALLRLCVFIRRKNVDVLHAHMMTGALLGRISTTFTHAKVVTTVHNSWQKHSILMRAGHQVIAVSDAVRQEMIRRGVPAYKMHTVLNGTLGSSRNNAIVPQVPILFEHPAVLSVAGIYIRKGIADLIEAAALLRERIPNLKIYIAGKGDDLPLFESQVKSLGLSETVTFLGFRGDIDCLLKQADVFVLPSHSEPFGLVLIEARNAGVPIVATDVDGIPEALEGGSAGLLVSPHNPRALAEAIARVLGDPALQQQLRQAGKEKLEKMQVKRVSDETLGIYSKALGRCT